MVHATDSAIGRTWDSADSAKLITGQDWARWELHWADGACIQCCEDTVQDAVNALARFGFHPNKGKPLFHPAILSLQFNHLLRS